MRRHADAGFTLIEVLIALAIVAALLLPLLRSFSNGVGSASKTGAFTEATLIAESTVETIGADVTLSDVAGLDQRDGAYHVVASVQRYSANVNSNQPGQAVVPYEVVVTVSWPEGSKTRSIKLRSLRLGPPAAAQASQ
jgi:prepilin-type N-terminal cleavage/methylation domain-containing protein